MGVLHCNPKTPKTYIKNARKFNNTNEEKKKVKKEATFEDNVGSLPCQGRMGVGKNHKIPACERACKDRRIDRGS